MIQASITKSWKLGTSADDERTGKDKHLGVPGDSISSLFNNGRAFGVTTLGTTLFIVTIT
jgi:hypothetical protein